MKNRYYIIVIVILVIVISPVVSAVEENPKRLLQEAPNQFYYPDKDAVVWKEEQVFDYTNKNHQKHYYYAIKIFNKQGVKDYSQVEIKYHPKRQQIKNLTAKVIKPSGKVIEVNQIKEEVISYTPNSTKYQSNHKKTINFPQVTAGSILIYSYQKEITKPLLAKEIQEVIKINSHQSKVILKIPQNKKVYTEFKPRDQLAKPDISRQNKAKVYTWNGYKAQGELLISSFKSWQQFSKWYQNLIPQEDALNKKLKEQVRNLTRGLMTKEAKIREIYNYVTTEIKYIDHQLGVNGYQPLSVNQIYQQKYAVAKDKVHFLISLLEEIDIKAVPIVLNSRSNFDSSTAAADFNHLLLYLPEQNLYLDPVSGYIRYGNLSLRSQGKKSLNLATAQITKTPILPKETNQEQVKTVIDLTDSGTANIKLNLQTKGFYDFIAKAIFGELNSIGQKEMIYNILNRYYDQPEIVKLNISGVDDVKSSAEFDLEFEANNYYNDQSGQISIQALTMPISYLLSIADVENTLPCKINKEFIIKFPAGYTVVNLPQDKEIANNEGQLRVDYNSTGQQVAINFNYQFNKLANVESVSWFYIENLLEGFKEIQNQEILLQ